MNDEAAGPFDPVHTTPGELPIGARIAEYRVRQRLGAGAIWTTYAAVHPQLGTKVVVKAIHAAQPVDAAQQERLLKHARRLTAVKHPLIASTLEVLVVDETTVCLVGEYVQGRPLVELTCRGEVMAENDAAPVVQKLLEALTYLHQLGLCHGGLQPEQVYLTARPDGAWPPLVRLVDAGVLPLFEEVELFGARELLSRTGAAYYAPSERLQGRPASAADDLYSAAAIAHQLLTGRLPLFTARPNLLAELRARVPARTAAELAAVSAATSATLARALSERSQERFTEALALGRELPLASPTAAVGPTASTEGALRALGPLTAAPTNDADHTAPAALAQVDLARPDPLYSVHRPQGTEPAPEPAELPPPSPTTAPAPPLPSLISTHAAQPVTAPPGSLRMLSPLRAVALALVLATVVGSAAYRVVVGEWPLVGGEAAPSLKLGHLVLETVPAGADVRVDGVKRSGQTPLRLSQVVRGRTYDVSVQLAGYFSVSERMSLGLDEEERRVQLRLVPRDPGFGTLQLSVNVPADFFLSGRKVGTQTQRLTLAHVLAGAAHPLTVEAPGRRAITQRVQVEAGKIQVLQFELLAAPK